MLDFTFWDLPKGWAQRAAQIFTGQIIDYQHPITANPANKCQRACMEWQKVLVSRRAVTLSNATLSLSRWELQKQSCKSESLPLSHQSKEEPCAGLKGYPHRARPLASWKGKTDKFSTQWGRFYHTHTRRLVVGTTCVVMVNSLLFREAQLDPRVVVVHQISLWSPRLFCIIIQA